MQHLNRLLGWEEGFFNTYLTDRPLNLAADNVITTIDREQVGNYPEYFINCFDSVFKGMFVTALLFLPSLGGNSQQIGFGQVSLKHRLPQNFWLPRRGIISHLFISCCHLHPVFYLVNLPLFIYLLKAIVTASTAKLAVYLEARIAPVHYLYLLLIGLGIFCLVQLWQRRKIGRLDMVAELKTING